MYSIYVHTHTHNYNQIHKHTKMYVHWIKIYILNIDILYNLCIQYLSQYTLQEGNLETVYGQLKYKYNYIYFIHLEAV